MANSIETLIQKSTIEFRHDLSRKETEEMLKHMCRVMRVNIGYEFTYHGNILHEASGMPTDDPGSFKAVGAIRRIDDVSASDTFETRCSGRDYQKASAIHFNLVPGWGEADYRPGVLQLWDDTRKAVDSYFQQRLNDRDHSA